MILGTMVSRTTNKPFAVPSAGSLVNFVSRNGEPTVANDAWRKLERVVGFDCLGDRHIDVGLDGSRMYVGLDRTWRIITPYDVS